MKGLYNSNFKPPKKKVEKVLENVKISYAHGLVELIVKMTVQKQLIDSMNPNQNSHLIIQRKENLKKNHIELLHSQSR